MSLWDPLEPDRALLTVLEGTVQHRMVPEGTVLTGRSLGDHPVRHLMVPDGTVQHLTVQGTILSGAG